ncbi:EAL domain-containing protein [Pseudidiomarina gelatinasegens]|uniref:cyclic-guanylate-specific phosphodiesterase n=1 Tax=Pseudidiomarina gelatinasegens TaxID=2487740 RepID=A0A443Z3W9_9GAMM|nr:EAL domain-containing protein [Pseudidiomarina gelatinasegens]RWU11255.1 EAL domain-containing protein [Pseudidiomarina gelatinasegens]
MDVDRNRFTESQPLEYSQGYLLERAVQSSINSIVIIDALVSGRPLVYANAAFYRTTGYHPTEVLGKSLHFLQGPDSDPAAVNSVIHALEHHQELKTSILNYRKDGTSYWNEVHISPVLDATNKVTHFIGVLLDVSDKRAIEEQLIYNQTHDPLTGCLNRSHLEERVTHDLVLAKRQRQMLALYYIDLDKFKAINDAFGINCGDNLLKQVASRILALLDPGDTLARVNADEFVLLVPEVDDADEGHRIAQRLQSVFAQPFQLGEYSITVTASIGIAAYEPQHKVNVLPAAESLIQHADMAMYQAKLAGRNTVHWFSQQISSQLSEKLLLRQQLHDALTQEQLELYYQPILCSDKQSVCALECLLRWHHPERGMVSPAEFIPLAEESGQIVPIGNWVLEQACRDIMTINKGREIPLSVAVNISAVQFTQITFLQTVRDIMARTGIDPECLELEITESVLMADEDRAIDTIHTLDSMGVRVSLDDFGTGYSSLAYLRFLPVHKIKIDRSFVREIAHNKRDNAILSGIVSMAHKLNLIVVAEGVEDEVQAQLLRESNCDLLQGFLYAKPQPLARLVLK